MKILTKAVFVSLTMLSGSLVAESWNDEIVNKVKKLRKAGDIDEAWHLLGVEMDMEAERNIVSGVKILERKKYIEMGLQAGLPSIETTASEYEAIVDVPYITSQGKDIIKQVRVPVSPDEVEKMKAEAAGVPREQLAQVFATMTYGLFKTGEALRSGIKDSGWGAILSKKGAVSGYDNVTENAAFQEACIAYSKYAALASSDDNAKSHIEKAQVGITDSGIDPMLMMLGPSCMLADAARNFAKPTDTYMEVKTRADKKFMRSIQEKIDQIQTNRISAKNLNLKQKTEDGNEVIIESMDVWIDPEYFKRRKTRFEGTMIENGKPRKFFMERKNSDYRRVGSSYLYEPYKEELTFGGMIDEKQRKELAQAQKELAKFEKELAAMPASQRKMMESMFSSQMEQLRKMVDGGAVTVTVLTKDIIINPDLGDKGVMYTVLSEKANKPTTSDFIGMMSGGALVQLIQQNLTKLGYQPGAATGELSDETRAAISKYQKDKGLAVTGKPSVELARQTQNEVEALSL